MSKVYVKGSVLNYLADRLASLVATFLYPHEVNFTGKSHSFGPKMAIFVRGP
jgi:hypothetical protein